MELPTRQPHIAFRHTAPGCRPGTRGTGRKDHLLAVICGPISLKSSTHDNQIAF